MNDIAQQLKTTLQILKGKKRYRYLYFKIRKYNDKLYIHSNNRKLVYNILIKLMMKRGFEKL